MGSEIQEGVIRAQIREIQISRVTYQKIYIYLKKVFLGVFIWNWKSFLQLFSKLNLKNVVVVSFMNRKYSCGFATHFFFF
jgi:hypothetical protein